MTHYQEHPAKTPIIKFKDQDFYSLRDQCLSKGQLFEDETFPAMASSIGPKLLKERDLFCLQWKRPWDKDLSSGSPDFILGSASRFDIQQGSAGDCWVLAALGSLTQNPRRLERIMPKDQSFSRNYAGIFHFQFWQCSRWVDVVVDDRLPLLSQEDGLEYLFVRPSRHRHEFWPCLLEKAYAKLHGSYSHLHLGYLPDALVDLTGGVVTHMDENTYPSNLVMVVKMAASAGSLMACTTPRGPTDRDQVLENGLVAGHAYTVTGAEQIQYRRGWEDIIRLWNPGGKTEWRGRWSDGSQEWQETHDPRRSQLYENKEYGEFWMSCQDFRENFSRLYICNQIPISLQHGNTFHESWSQLTMFKNQEGPWRDHPHFSVPEGTEGINAVVSVTMRPQSLRVEEEELPLTFHLEAGLLCSLLCGRVLAVAVVSSHEEASSPEHFTGTSTLAGVTALTTLPSPLLYLSSSESKKDLPQIYAVRGMLLKTKYNLTECFQLSPGSYVLVPWTSRKDAQFLLRVFLKLPDIDRNLNSNIGLGEQKASLPEHGSQESIFHRYAQQSSDLGAPQLQSLLNQEFLRGSPGDTFSLDACRGLVALMDLKVNGRLDLEEFVRLWRRLVDYQRVFQKIQKSSGFLLSSDLWKAIENTDFLAGISVSKELLELMSLRYSDSAGRVSFPSLVCFLIRLETMAKTFRNLSQDGIGLYLTEMEWMNLVMYT
ncbi:calpain-13-like [Dasypus novemcinctus]|uniref:calpain-13-like n=1 Tax=Dasypus novemcinctus TaxID=9361 RepID=UPI00265F9A97|nr:calpain-13-like [Dasypus novemcinctus]